MQRRNYIKNNPGQHLIIFVFLLFISITVGIKSANAQDEEKPSLNTGPIEQQFDYMVDKSSNYEEYKVIKKAWVYTFRSHFLDSLKSMRTDISGKQALIHSKNTRIDSLNAELQQTREDLQTAIKNRDSLTLLGISMYKNIYNGVMWTLIAALIVALAVFIGLFKRSNKITVQTRNDLDELKQEFEEHRRHSREQMEIVKRKHLDEINKLRNSH
ncbi:MAG TPA: hypothetical protein VE870_00860 [Bacteroidales bacterium]|nr:hypothetical protein [Bacteroidales bacterium]